MFYYILYGTTLYFVCCNWKNIIWSFFYYYACIECFVKSRLQLKDNSEQQKRAMYLGILKTNKKIERYDFSRKQDYLFYYCENYKDSPIKTNYNFITITLNVSNGDTKDSHTISLHNQKNTFYLENNEILTKDFIKWYCFSYKNIILPENYTYEITLIDNMANIQTIKENQYIKLNKDFYEIKNIS